MIVVTGGAGFIGANIIAGLNRRGERNIVLVDDLSNTAKIPNISDLMVADYLDKTEFQEALRSGSPGFRVEAIFHEGACSDTMASDGRYVMDNNYRYTRDLYHFCQQAGARLIYASSASVYGAHIEFAERAENERPLNAYAYSKFQFDNYIRHYHDWDGPQVVGLRYFNVYGYRENHKGRMASVAWHFFHQYREHGRVRLFAGTDGYHDGEQRRDFIFIDDVVAVNLHFLDHPERRGIFNVGTGTSRTFNDVAVAVVNTLLGHAGKPPMTREQLVAGGHIEYIPLPDSLRGKYQSYTEADIQALRGSGYADSFSDVADGVSAYVDWLITQG